MLSSPVPLLRERQREFLERALARRITIRPEDIIGHAVVMTDSQWRTWRDIRGLFLAMRYAHERRAALSIPLPEAAA
ncbi:hypothetical protein [Lichenibacterium dinghuense]|uniref:hypothetical protein n=1 Tax=Lichenibacterium dinghuense TaxID=2895977 RepID=UPI001F193385|nr:hypothetical protein [Lichenibacterium sp. 6Y81]